MSGQCRELKRLATLERNRGKEQIRWSWDLFSSDGGELSRYVSVRKWYKSDNGQWRTTKAGITIRLSELDEVVTALQRLQRARDAHEGDHDDDREATPRGGRASDRHLSPEELDETF